MASEGHRTVSSAGGAAAASLGVMAYLSGMIHYNSSRITIWRPSTQEWIDHLNWASFGGGKRMGYWAWHPGDIDLRWNRQILSTQGPEITLNAPVTCSIEQRWGGAKVIVYRFGEEEDYDISLYGFTDRVGVGIFDNRCKVDFAAIKKYLKRVYGS